MNTRNDEARWMPIDLRYAVCYEWKSPNQSVNVIDGKII